MKKLTLLLALCTLFIFSCKKSNDCDDQGTLQIKYDVKIEGNEDVVLDFYLDNATKAASLKYGEEATVDVDTDEYFVSAYTSEGFLYENKVEEVKACVVTVHKVSDNWRN